MTLEQLASLGEIIAAIAVVVSLIFLALEVRKNTSQSKTANWGFHVDRILAVFALASDTRLADLIAKGRESYHDLSEGEKISFGYYLEQICIGFEGMLITAGTHVHERELLFELFKKHMRFHLGAPGAREWFAEFEKHRGFPPSLSSAIREAIGED